MLWKFPQLVAFSAVAARERSSISNEDWQKLETDAEAYREELRSMPGDDIKALLSKARLDEAKRYEEHREAEERKRVFNRPNAAADYQHWASASYWTLDETTALSFGKDPRVVTWKVVSPHINISPFAKAFAARRDLVYRAGVMGQLAQHTQPSMVIAWARRMRVPMPTQLVTEVESLGIQIADWKTLFDQQKESTEQERTKAAENHAAYLGAMKDHSETISKMRGDYGELLDQKDSLITLKDERIELLGKRLAETKAALVTNSGKSLGAKERDSLLKLVIGMAIKGYSHNPKLARSPIAKEIAGDLALVGLPLDEDTVRKYLLEAKELLPVTKPNRTAETEFG